MNKKIQEQIEKLLEKAGVKMIGELTVPPKSEMGDVALPCFGLAKKGGVNPVAYAKELAKKLSSEKLRVKSSIIDNVKAFGPYVNFFLNAKVLAEDILEEAAQEKYGQSDLGGNKKILVEFAHPNTHKAFHIGHLRNITTGESLARIFESVGYSVTRVNYQGDVGLHIAKCLWGTERLPNEYAAVRSEGVAERAAFLGQAYAKGGVAYEENEQAKEEVAVINAKIYSGADEKVNKLYQETRQWSLDYFNTIYQRVGTKFDRLYFESEVFKRGKEIVFENIKKGIFAESQGAVIFPGEKYGLHNRVFLNSQGLPTYEAKDLALAELQFKEYHPEKIFHVVGKEQTEYFRVLFKALEFVLPKSRGREVHLDYGWVTLKEGKMSSRTGNVVLGESLIEQVKGKIHEQIQGHDVANPEEVIEKVAIAAIKYSFLRTGVANDIAFDFNESVSLTGDSGPYLLYMCTRIKSILAKAGVAASAVSFPESISPAEKNLLLSLSNFSGVVARAATEADPSQVAHYLLELAHRFSEFYEACPVLNAEETVKSFRLALVKAVLSVAEKGLYLLGIQTVETM